MLVALTVTVGIGVVRGALAPIEAVPVESGSGSVTIDGDTPADAGRPASVFVHVSGAVAAPGLYVLDDGARVVDAIAAAGGFTAEADESAVNLARRSATASRSSSRSWGAHRPRRRPDPQGTGGST